MGRNLIFDILLMSLFLIFGGSLASAQTPIQIFGKKIKTNAGGPAESSYDCTGMNRDGEFCFSTQFYFSSLDFPCDLYVGLTVEGIGETIFTSLSGDNIGYEYLEATGDYGELYEAKIELACISSEKIHSVFNMPIIDGKDCIKNNGVPKTIGFLNLHYDIYCKNDKGIMVPVNPCEDFSDFIYNTNESLEDCSFRHSSGFNVCCEAADLPEIIDVSPRSLDESREVEISFQGSAIIIEGSKLKGAKYQIYGINGSFQVSGTLENSNSKIYTINNVSLNNGIYIIVINAEGHQSSHKLVSFR